MTNNNYYLVVKLNNKIKSKDVRKRLVNSQYLTSKTWAFKYFNDELDRMLRSEKEKVTVEIWYVKKTENKVNIQVLKSYKKTLDKVA